ncbi:uncharacterized protein LOC142588739 [Dermacentor variabilis]|uniref:uncharacterized protein LOC142588739 n=1 Tax=Dermacentor variabilis TaxID=34621 RepID=UPI003F5B7996
MPGIRYFRCPRCGYPTFSLKELFRHLRIAHGHEDNWLCGLGGCMKTFRLFLSYKRHVYRNHPELLTERTQPIASVPLEMEQTSVFEPHSEERTEAQEVLGDPEPSQSSSSLSKYVDQLATLLLKWKEARRLPESTLNEIANDVISFINIMLEDAQLCTNIGAVVHAEQEWKQQLNQLLSKSGRLRYWKTHFPIVEPRTTVLGTDGHGRFDTMEYVPLCDVLKCVLENTHLSDDFNSYPRKENYLCSAFDGTEFQNHAYFAGDTSKLCIQLYSDEFEVCNPLGSKRGKHKMTAVYFSVLNFATKFRSALSGIHLVLLVKDKHVATYGFSKVLAPLITDVNELEDEGIVVNGTLLKGSVFIFTGDNLSSHRVGGFKCSFSHGRICRFCMALHHELNHKFLESDFLLRTPEGHQHHLNMLSAGLPTASLYGVREACALTFNGFNPTQHLPPDVMHDIHEGVLPFALQHIISSLIKQNFFSLTYLNKMICEWNYDAHDVRNKPEPLSKEFLKGKADAWLKNLTKFMSGNMLIFDKEYEMNA